MAHIESFEAIHYNAEVIQDISKVVCPPYDVVDPKAQDECYQKHPYNIIRLILGKDFNGDATQENKYSRAASYLEEWLRRGILIQETQPSIYFYEQIFTPTETMSLSGVPATDKKRRRLGFIALMQLDEDGKQKSVYPHEHTHDAPKEDRFRLIKSVEANLSPIFTIYSDPDHMIRDVFEENLAKETPLFEMVDACGIEHRIWRLSSKPLIEKVKSFLAQREVFIADGHHRYEVAKMFRDYKRQQQSETFKNSYNYIMTYFTPLEDDGLCILPTHRLLKDTHFSLDDFRECFTIREIASSKEGLISEMKARKDEVGVFGLYKEKKYYLLKVAEKRECNRFIQEGPKGYKNLDVIILHKVLFDHFLKLSLNQISYEVDLSKAIQLVDEKVYDALFVLNPTKIGQIRSIALSGEVMPQKSTYFYPKLLSGFLIHKF